MEIIPAIDIREGRCVRLLQGDPRRMVVYGDDPVAVASRWVQDGARWLHVVDLDGAFAGHPIHLPLVKAIAELRVPVQVGGGYRTLHDVEAGFAAGAERVVLSTAARTLAGEAAQRFGERVVVSIDARDGQVAVEGWATAAGMDAIGLAEELKGRGIRRFIYTDIARDGMLRGPALATLQAFVCAVATPVIAAGGIATESDIAALEPTGVEGVIIGRALYEGQVNLQAMLLRWGRGSC